MPLQTYDTQINSVCLTIYCCFKQLCPQNLKIRLFFRKQQPNVGHEMSLLRENERVCSCQTFHGN